MPNVPDALSQISDLTVENRQKPALTELVL